MKEPGNKPPPLNHHQTIAASEPQLQSQLLARLSPELRLMIWGFVLADQRIHIIQRKQRLGHIVCPCPLDKETKPKAKPLSPSKYTRQNTTLICDICHGTGISQPAREADLLRAGVKVKLLGLALTCRQMYEKRITHPSPYPYPSLPAYIPINLHQTPT